MENRSQHASPKTSLRARLEANKLFPLYLASTYLDRAVFHGSIDCRKVTRAYRLATIRQTSSYGSLAWIKRQSPGSRCGFV
jgi:hypothetical protein